jgi:hypothetical protein
MVGRQNSNVLRMLGKIGIYPQVCQSRGTAFLRRNRGDLFQAVSGGHAPRSAGWARMRQGYAPSVFEPAGINPASLITVP